MRLVGQGACAAPEVARTQFFRLARKLIERRFHCFFVRASRLDKFGHLPCRQERQMDAAAHVVSKACGTADETSVAKQRLPGFACWRAVLCNSVAQRCILLPVGLSSPIAPRLSSAA